MEYLKRLYLFIFFIVFLSISLLSCSHFDIEESQYITANNTEPLNPLIPSNSSEYGGSRIIHLVFAGLKYADADGNILNDVAKEVSTDDHQHYLITIKKDVLFSDGSKVTSDSFIKAWNYAIKNQHRENHYLRKIEGFPETAEQRKNFDTLSGLKKIDDENFSITLKEPVYDFEDQLIQVVFFPLPEKAYEDIEKFGNYPIGNGPYKFKNANSWKHNQSITLIPNELYQGERKAKNKGIKFVIYAKPSAAYADLLSGELDILDTIPDEALSTLKQDVGNRIVSKSTSFLHSIEINVNKEHFRNDLEGRLRRKAISMSINREEIVNLILKGIDVPAQDFTSPSVPGFNPNIKGSQVLEYRPEEAKKLWQQADKINPFKGSFTIAYNTDSGSQSWVDAIINQLKNNLKIEAYGIPYPDFKSLLTDQKNRNIKLACRRGWMADYPSRINFLNQVFATDAIGTKENPGSNNTDYSNKSFDDLIDRAEKAKNIDERNQALDEAQQILFQELPAIPLWNNNTTVLYGKNIRDVKINWNGIPVYYLIQKN